MSNPFTRFLSRQVQDRRLLQFVAWWDRLEALVIAVYRANQAGEADEREWAEIRAALVSLYPGMAGVLQPFWQQAQVSGQPADQDPFAHLLTAPQAAAFVGNWDAMQRLPAAREALNHLILARGRS